MTERKLKITLYFLSGKLFNNPQRRTMYYTYEELANMFQIPEKLVRAYVNQFDREMRRPLKKRK